MEYFSQVYKALLVVTKDTPGATVENNKVCLSVHFRRVHENVRTINCFVLKPVMFSFYYCLRTRRVFCIRNFLNMKINLQKWAELAKQVGSVLEAYPEFRLTQGRKVCVYLI